MSNCERPRLTVDLEPGQKEKLKKLLPWGIQKRVVSSVINLLIEFIATNGLGKCMDALDNKNVKLVIKNGDD